ncbi:MAG: hypothetical protein KatS3mg129_0260 [Leptospiraceae bacterium]|nr:MAG: hypothetical protein KatS3mg129_0260 [Leptospiraceae bacterium]
MNSSNKKQYIIFIILWIIPEILYPTNGFFMISYGAKFSGIAGAGASTKESIFSNYLNPANLSFYLEENYSIFEFS